MSSCRATNANCAHAECKLLRLPTRRELLDEFKKWVDQAADARPEKQPAPPAPPTPESDDVTRARLAILAAVGRLLDKAVEDTSYPPEAARIALLGIRIQNAIAGE